MVAAAPREPLNGLLDAEGVCGLPADDGRGDPVPFMLSRTWRCCLLRASLSTMTPGVAELRAAGVFGSDTGLCRNFSFNCCCFGGAGTGDGAATDILSLSFGCGGSSTLALASASRFLNKACVCEQWIVEHSQAYAYLELKGYVVDVAAILIVISSVDPYQARCLFKGIPALQFRDTGWRIAANDAANFLLYRREGHGLLDQLIVVLQRPARQLHEGLENWQTAPIAASVMTKYVKLAHYSLWLYVVDQLANDPVLHLLEGLSRKVRVIIWFFRGC